MCVVRFGVPRPAACVRRACVSCVLLARLNLLFSRTRKRICNIFPVMKTNRCVHTHIHTYTRTILVQSAFGEKWISGVWEKEPSSVLPGGKCPPDFPSSTSLRTRGYREESCKCVCARASAHFVLLRPIHTPCGAVLFLRWASNHTEEECSL